MRCQDNVKMIVLQKFFHFVEHQFVYGINGGFYRKSPIAVAYAVYRTEETRRFLCNFYIAVRHFFVKVVARKAVRVEHNGIMPAPCHFFFYCASRGIVSTARAARQYQRIHIGFTSNGGFFSLLVRSRITTAARIIEKPAQTMMFPSRKMIASSVQIYVTSVL